MAQGSGFSLMMFSICVRELTIAVPRALLQQKSKVFNESFYWNAFQQRAEYMLHALMYICGTRWHLTHFLLYQIMI
jgi:hypothetical protein